MVCPGGSGAGCCCGCCAKTAEPMKSAAMTERVVRSLIEVLSRTRSAALYRATSRFVGELWYAGRAHSAGFHTEARRSWRSAWPRLCNPSVWMARWTQFQLTHLHEAWDPCGG